MRLLRRILLLLVILLSAQLGVTVGISYVYDNTLGPLPTPFNFVIAQKKDLIQTNLVQMIINRPKVPYTDPGIQLCVANLTKSLQQAVNAGVIAPDEIDADGKTIPGFVITAPISAEIDPLQTDAEGLVNFTFNQPVNEFAKFSVD